ncbi:hypothetical protein [Christiangramia sp. OXR-203]|jgi:hypothetical protein|uniref:hypothetical protein n=1 Tax=Christiangramia sp. OXR-203 TaxID=3100176 RepID=UPI002AC9180A|nr:hypothetical protein [Christiangramia sp. OXR-203]WPY97665.1 hypothetical protein T8I65_10810 [Christiangramia sp. OXR-203]
MKIKSYTEELEEVNNFILKNKTELDKISFSALKNRTSEFPVLKKAINKSELSAITLYQEKGIVFKFQCTNNSNGNFIDSDDKYYLIKILNGKTELLGYEQFVDYSKSPIELGNNWYLIEQNITYD